MHLKLRVVKSVLSSGCEIQIRALLMCWHRNKTEEKSEFERYHPMSSLDMITKPSIHNL